MSAYYPGVIFPFIDDLIDNSSIVLAEHVNDLRLEVRAIEFALGTNPTTGWQIDDNYSVIDTEYDFTDLKARLAALEKAAMRNFDSFYVSRAGGSIVNRTVNESGIGIKTLAINGVETFPALEILKDGQDGWTGNVADRSHIRLWGNGTIDAQKLRFGNMLGLLDETVMTLGSSSIKVDGSLVLPNSTWISGSNDVRVRSTLGVGSTGVLLKVADASATALRVTNNSDAALLVITGTGSLTAGNITLDAAASEVNVGPHTSLGLEGLTVGENVHVTQTGLRIDGSPLTLHVTTGGIYLRDGANANVVELSPSKFAFGLGELAQNRLLLASPGVWAGGAPTVSLSSDTSSLTFNKAATIEATDEISIEVSDDSKIVVGSATSEIKAGLVLNLGAGLATGRLENHVTEGSKLTIGGSSLSNLKLRLNDFDTLFREPGHLKLKSPEASHLYVGVAGAHYINGVLMNGEFANYMKITETGTTITGDVVFPNNQSTVWPVNMTSPSLNKYWLTTRPRYTNAPSDLRPTYWDALKTAPDDNSPNAKTSFDFIAPATGEVKITFSGELAGNVSRSALSYQIMPYDDNGQLGWVPVLSCGQANSISFNAPAVDVPGDWYYTQLTNVSVAFLTPGKKYQLQIRGQRAIPGTDAENYFPWDPNYQWDYPWGRYFDVNFLRVLIEPMFTSVRVVGSA